ncbi:MAG: serine/threonine-protein kinase [Cyanobacteriota bacterium]
MVWVAGQKLQGGKYTIEKELGEGGFGITYLAKDNNGQQVVIKTLNDAVQRRPDFAKFQQDFLNEALRLARCNHPHIVRIDEVINEGHLWCMVMEYIDGEDLANRVENQGALPEVEALRYIQQIGEALTVVHNNGLLHRDIKPHNIMLRSDKPEAVLIDFGIARKFTPNLTQTHTQFLVDGFAPIEEYDKRAKRGAYTDIYALAATLYVMLTGEVPTSAPVRAVSTPLESPKQINPTISQRVNQAILKGMELKAEKRPQSMQEWLELIGKPILQPSVPLVSEQGVDYKNLWLFLILGEWKEADRETGKRLLEAAGREEEGYLNDWTCDIDEITCEDLYIIDQLWSTYSNGHFGFSVQKRIWESVNQDWDKFCERVGWERKRQIDDDQEECFIEPKLNFTFKASPGHLPTFIGPSTGTVWIEGSGRVWDDGCWSEDFEPGWAGSDFDARNWYEIYGDGEIFDRIEECGL